MGPGTMENRSRLNWKTCMRPRTMGSRSQFNVIGTLVGNQGQWGSGLCKILLDHLYEWL